MYAIRSYYGFTLTGHSLNLYGYCDAQECQDALSVDNRITDIRDFYYTDKTVYFTIDTIYGSANLSTEVMSDENL